MFRFLLCFFLFISPVIAQTANPKEEKAPPPVQMIWDIPSTRPPSKNIFFIVDTSGSMDGVRVQSAIQMVMMIAGQVIDDLQVATISFGSSTKRWPGTLDVDPQTQIHQSRKGWSAMPSAYNLQELHTWLQNNRDSSGTNMLTPINQAFDSCLGNGGYDAVDDLSIYIISDGEVSNYSAIKTAIIQHQARRIKANLNPAAIGFIGINVKPKYGFQIKELIGSAAAGSPEHMLPPGPNPQPLPFDATPQYQADLGQLGYCRIEYIKEEEDND